MKNKDKGISSWGLALMALGTVIGGSFFLGSVIPLKNSGPSIILAYLVGGGLVYLILFALSEMTVANPDPGSFRTYAEKNFGPFAGFVVGWVYWTGLILAMSSEAVAVSEFIRLWVPRLSIPIAGSIIIISVILINLLGTSRLSKLESSLAAVKLLAIIGFIILSLTLIVGLFTKSPVGFGEIRHEAFLPKGFGGLAGSMLIVMFAYAGFEIIGLASSEARNPEQEVPRAIAYTVVSLVALYILSMFLILPLIPVSKLPENVSPFVAALQANGFSWAATVINAVLITAILSTMLASTYGLGKMLRSIADKGFAPNWLKDKGDVPYRCIIFSGISMLASFGLSFFLPKNVYIFLVSAGSFSLLFAYLIIVLTHYKFRKINGCPPDGKCQMKGYPYTSWIAIVGLIAIIASMPLVPGQGAGLISGLILIGFYSGCYFVYKRLQHSE